MNPRLPKINDEIVKTKGKLADYQNRLRDLERLKTELENADIVALVRGVDALPDELVAFIKAYQDKSSGLATEPSEQETNPDEKEGNGIEN